MLKSYSKKAMDHVMDYIRDEKEYLIDQYDFTESDLRTDNRICFAIWSVFKREMIDHDQYIRRTFGEYALFEQWAEGLALSYLFTYYIKDIAVDLAGSFLEETEEEKSQFSEREAEKLITSMIYERVIKGKNKVSF